MFTKEPFTPGAEGVWLNLSAEVYHKAPGVSQSALKEFEEHASPLHYKSRKRKVPTEDMEFGTICHTAVLEPENLATAYYVRPATYPATVKKKGEPDKTVDKPWNGNSNWCEEWLETHADRPVITAEKEAAIPRIVERVTALDEFGSALKNGYREVSFFKRDEVTGLLLKCRVDVLALTHDQTMWIFDLKKIQAGEGDKEAWQKQAEQYGYHIQCASYLKITGAARFVFVPFDDSEPFDACQFRPDEEMLNAGLFEWRRILDAYAKCVKEDRWPGYASGIQPMALPDYAKKKLTQAQHDAWALKVAGGLV